MFESSEQVYFLPIIMQDSYHTCVPRLNLGPFCMTISQVDWEEVGSTGLRWVTRGEVGK